MVVKTFGVLLRRYRYRRGLSQRRLASMINMNGSHLSRIERGHKPPPRRDSIAKLSIALQLNDEERDSFLEAAGYATVGTHEPIGFGSPFLIGPATGDPSLPETVANLHGIPRSAVKCLVDILTLQSLDQHQRQFVAKQTVAFLKGIMNLLEGLTNGKGQNDDPSTGTD